MFSVALWFDSFCGRESSCAKKRLDRLITPMNADDASRGGSETRPYKGVHPCRLVMYSWMALSSEERVRERLPVFGAKVQ